MRIAVLVSGNGSNLQSLLDVCHGGGVPATVALVLSNNANVYALERAKRSKVKTVVLSHKDYPTREAYDAVIDRSLREHKIDFICLAGFKRLLTPWFVQQWHNKVINIHPSLLPSFKGLNTFERAMAAGVKFTGCTVHFVRAEMDEGPIIVQASVPIDPYDTTETLKARVQHAEHMCYPLALRLVAEKRLHLEGEKVVYAKNTEVPHMCVMNPLAY
jgi:phosphoribosylglycinamide formyltransferase 1